MNHHGLTGIATALALAFPVIGHAQQALDNQAPVSLPVVVVQGISQSLADPADDGYVALGVRSAMKSNMSLLETPQAVNVITRTEMDQQGATSVAKAVRYTPGVVAHYGDNDARYDWLTVRGFTPARYLDGLVLPFGVLGYAQPRVEPYGLERIEVLKGPSSGLFGQTSPGGLVNMVTKKPTEERVREVGVQVGSFDRKEAMFDLGGGVNESNTVLYRLTGVFRDSDTQFDHVDDKKQFIQGGLTFKISDATKLTLSGQYQKIESNGGGGAPVLPRVGTVTESSKGRLPRSRYVGDPDYDRFTNEQTLLGYTLDHQINDRLGFKQTARFSQVDTNSRRVQVGAVLADTQAVRYAWAFPEKATAVQIDNQLNADVDWGRTTHRLTAGVDYLREKANYTESQLGILLEPGSTAYDLFDLYNPNYGNKNISVPPAATRIHQTREQVGVYLQDQISIDKWLLTLTGRQDWASLDRSTKNVTANTSRDSNADYHRFTGRSALSYVFDNGVAPYISYSTSFQPVAGQSVGGESLKPTTGKQIEVGVKYKPTNYDALLTASLFQIKQDNVTAPTADARYSQQAGQVKSRGLELEAKASLTKALDLTLAYTYMDTEITKANAAASSGVVGNRLNFVPRHQASAWADYTVQSGPLASLGVGAGVRHSSDVYGALSNAHATKTDGFTVFDAAVRYDLGQVGLKGADVSVNVDNLFDKKYVASCLSANACYWGTERTVYANLRYRW